MRITIEINPGNERLPTHKHYQIPHERLSLLTFWVVHESVSIIRSNSAAFLMNCYGVSIKRHLLKSHGLRVDEGPMWPHFWKKFRTPATWQRSCPAFKSRRIKSQDLSSRVNVFAVSFSAYKQTRRPLPQTAPTAFILLTIHDCTYFLIGAR
jgi:hypothetical protein